ncbi:hypothetical protein H0H93_001597 [Arthromyces matolae]|nr:hypothetical protein H0H93_001597 [Arthromyces matolae]
MSTSSFTFVTYIDWILGLLLGQMFHVQRLKLYRITSQITISHPSTSLCWSEESRTIMRIDLASVICSLAITRFFLAAAIPIQPARPLAPVNTQADGLPEWVKSTVNIPGAFMPHEDNNSPSLEMYIPRDADIPAVVSVVNILGLMRLTATGSKILASRLRYFEGKLGKALLSLPNKPPHSMEAMKDDERDGQKRQVIQAVKNHNNGVWYHPERLKRVEQEVIDALKLRTQSTKEVNFGENWGQGNIQIPKRYTPKRIKIRIPVDADIPGVASLLNIVDFMRQNVPRNPRPRDLEGFIDSIGLKLRLLPQKEPALKQDMAHGDWKVELLEIVKDHNKRKWYQPHGWGDIEEKVRAALKSGVSARQPKQISDKRREVKSILQSLRTLPVPDEMSAAAAQSSKSSPPAPIDLATNLTIMPPGFPSNTPIQTTPHPHPSGPPQDQIHAHDLTLDPHANLHLSSNSFDFNVPRPWSYYSSTTPMVPTAVSQEIPSSLHGLFLHPLEDHNMHPQVMNLPNSMYQDFNPQLINSPSRMYQDLDPHVHTTSPPSGLDAAYNQPSDSRAYSQQSSVESSNSSLGLPPGYHASFTTSSGVIGGGSPHHVVNYPSPPPPPRWT